MAYEGWEDVSYELKAPKQVKGGAYDGWEDVSGEISAPATKAKKKAVAAPRPAPAPAPVRDTWAPFSADRAPEDPLQDASFGRDVLWQSAKDIGKAAVNFGPSAAQIPVMLAKGAVQGFKNARDMGDEVFSSVRDVGVVESAKNFGKAAALDPFSERYGTAEAFRRTAIEDPAGMMLDESAALGIGGAGTFVASKGAGAVGAAGAAGKLASASKTLGAGARAIGSIPMAPSAAAAGGAFKLAGKGANVTGLPGIGDALGATGDKLLGAAKTGVESAKSGMKPITYPAGKIIKGVDARLAARKTPEILDAEIAQAVQQGMDKGIKPTVVGKFTERDRAAYRESSVSAARDIVQNKANLKLTDKDGNIIEGALPETVGQMAEAVYQTKHSIWAEVDDLVKQADGAGIQIPTRGAVSKLRSFADEIDSRPAARVRDKHVADYARALADSLEEAKSYSGGQAVGELAGINARFKGAMPNLNEAKTILVDQLLAEDLRAGLDAAVEGTTGTGTAAIRKRYGALKAIEKDVNHRAGIVARQSPVGLAGYVDALGSAETVYGAIRLLSGDPSALIKGLTVKGAAKYIQAATSPDRAIKNMFKTVDRAATNPNFARPAMKPAPAPDPSGVYPGYRYPELPPPAAPFPNLVKGPDGVYRLALPEPKSGFSLYGKPYGNRRGKLGEFPEYYPPELPQPEIGSGWRDPNSRRVEVRASGPNGILGEGTAGWPEAAPVLSAEEMLGLGPFMQEGRLPAILEPETVMANNAQASTMVNPFARKRRKK